MPMRCLVVAICGSVLSSVALAQGSWQPQPEPAIWREQRSALAEQYPQLAAPWIFMEADSDDRRRVAEYLRNRRSSADGTVRFDALLMLRRGSSPWVVRSLPMRALCQDGVLQRRGADQQWETYPSRPGSADRVSWICSAIDGNQP